MKKSDRRERSAWVLVAEYSGIAVMMPLAAVIGYYLGDLFDKHFHTGSIGQIIGLMLGAAGGFIELLRTISRDQ